MFVPAIRQLFRDAGVLLSENGREYCHSFLLGYNGRVYLVDNDMQINSSEDGFMALGHGAAYALGHLRGSSAVADGEQRVLGALEAAAHFSAVVRPDFHVEVL